MTWTAAFELPIPPSANNQYAVARGRLIPTKAKLTFAQTVKRLVGDSQCGAPPPKALLALDIAMHCDRRAFACRDLDNIIKPVQDAICAALGVNDARVAQITATKRIVKPHGYITATICELTI